MSKVQHSQLREAIASVIANEKAYDVPALCVRLGLEPGEEAEAMRSKARYATSRLAAVPMTRLVEIARTLLAENDNFWLQEIVSKVSETNITTVSALTRRRLMSCFDGEALCTEYDEIEFLESIWPVSSMAGISFNADTDFGIGSSSLKDDIIQHMRRNDDWSNKDLLDRLGLFASSQALLFRFLEASVHPITVGPEIQDQRVKRINAHLQHDGYRLVRNGSMSGNPVYAVAIHAIGTPADAANSSALEKFEPEQVHARWAAALDRRATDPAGAITLARTLMEDVCRWLLDELGETASHRGDLSALYRQLSKKLKLAPDDHTEQIFKQLLGSCQQIVELLGSLRNKLGDAHSGGPRRAKPAPRHAELAVNLAGSMATFLVSTWEARQSAAENTPG